MSSIVRSVLDESGNKDNYKSINEFEFLPVPTTELAFEK